MRILFLDDDEFRHDVFAEKAIDHDVLHVRSAKEAISAMKKERFDLACLDHDLGTKDTGYDVAVAIEGGFCHPPLSVIVHSYNPVGSTRMVYAIRRKTNAIALPFGPGMYTNIGKP